jgi:phage terminase large subunit-like protein
MSEKRIKKLQQLEKEIDRALVTKRYNKLRHYVPYMKQVEFHAMGAFKRERLLMAGNQQGKTYCGGMETAFHLTGQYPDDWVGRTWERPTHGWAGGVTSLATRDIVQAQLLGPSESWPDFLGEGAIPKEHIGKYSMARGIQNAVDTVSIKHVSGGWSTLSFKSYEQGRAKWQGVPRDFIWFDEEPDQDIYSEGLARVTATKGMVYMTFTPLKGMSSVVKRFLNESTADRGYVNMTIDDADHIDPEERQRIIDGYEEYERDARIKGIPMLGEGRIFMTPEEHITCDPFEIPRYWPVLAALDIGIAHPTAAVYMAWDRDLDIIYIIGEHRLSGANIPTHASAIRSWSPDIPVAWPHDAHSRDKGSGVKISHQYRDAGLKMMSEHAQFSIDEGGGNSVEAGISEMNERMKTGKWKVFRPCTKWFEEYRLYHRKDGMIVKEDDDLLSASRYGMMMKRCARPLTDLTGRSRKKRGRAKGLDFDVLG